MRGVGMRDGELVTESTIENRAGNGPIDLVALANFATSLAKVREDFEKKAGSSASSSGGQNTPVKENISNSASSPFLSIAPAEAPAAVQNTEEQSADQDLASVVRAIDQAPSQTENTDPREKEPALSLKDRALALLYADVNEARQTALKEQNEERAVLQEYISLCQKSLKNDAEFNEKRSRQVKEKEQQIALKAKQQQDRENNPELFDLKDSVMEEISNYIRSRQNEDGKLKLKRGPALFLGLFNRNEIVLDYKVSQAKMLLSRLSHASNTEEIRQAIESAQITAKSFSGSYYKGDYEKALNQCIEKVPPKELSLVKNEILSEISKYIALRSKAKLKQNSRGFNFLMFNENTTLAKTAMASALLETIKFFNTKESLIEMLNSFVEQNNILAHNSSFTKGDLGKALDKCLALAKKVAPTEVVGASAPSMTVN